MSFNFVVLKYDQVAIKRALSIQVNFNKNENQNSD